MLHAGLFIPTWNVPVERCVAPSGIQQPAAFGLRNGIAKFTRRVQPQRYGLVNIFQCCHLGIAVRHATGELGHFRYERLILEAGLSYLCIVVDSQPIFQNNGTT